MKGLKNFAFVFAGAGLMVLSMVSVVQAAQIRPIRSNNEFDDLTLTAIAPQESPGQSTILHTTFYAGANKNFAGGKTVIKNVVEIDLSKFDDDDIDDNEFSREFDFGDNANLSNNVNGVAVDSSGKIYVADTGNNRIAVFDNMGVLVDSFNRLKKPNDVAVDSSGKIYVADTGNNRVAVFNSQNKSVSFLPIKSKRLKQPNSLAVDSSGKIYVADTGNNRVAVFDSRGVLVDSFNGLKKPSDVAVDSSGNNVYVAVGDTGHKSIYLYNRNSKFVSTYATNNPDKKFKFLTDLAVDSSGNIYVVDADAPFPIYDNKSAISRITKLTNTDFKPVPFPFKFSP